MLNRVVVKNPGCPFCRHYLAPFKHNGKMTAEACLKGARRIFQRPKIKHKKRRWKWTNCAYPSEKNKQRTCADFQIQSLTLKLIHQFTLLIMRASLEDQPSFSGEIWWQT
ncbi:MAG: hypothetical protein HOE30_18585 [Deltaproteobacteria bacterium]|nr:hypothetical protein [Deltaproteobacteria bacterium]MBT4090498.1 hypothetical protein [Deltaproteobacteria bacterium]MBT4264981.1 hypothetical protein [Deltaproteobacteria bacterium]MBT6616378.1 hypothetical protein [Deltaproteobacteria bacterium]MBT7152591.1 hypothetical protein [Deltaproteobacteria bacterium]